MLTIHRYSHFIKIKPTTEEERKICTQFSLTLISFKFESAGGGNTVRVPDKVYAASNKLRTEFRFHRNSLENFIQYLKSKGYTDDWYEIQDHPFTPKRDVDIELKVKPNWKPYPHQVPIISYIQDMNHSPNHLVTLFTGGGKGICSMIAASEIGKRVLYLLRPAFIDKWYREILDTYELDEDEVVTVRGSAQLMALLAYAANPKNVMPKVIILSNKTYQNYLKQYEEFGEELLELGYDCLPEDLYEHLGVGIRYIDEVHLDYHLNFKADLYTNVYNASAFSASLIDSDPFMKRMYALAYPVPDRYKAPPPKKYIEAKGVMYKLVEGRNPKYTWRGRKEYSHGAYEQYLIKKPAMLANYLAMVKEIADNHYRGDEYREGDRLLIFCYSIDMATILTNYFKEQYSDLTVERYVEDDEYKNVMEPDVRISTVLSAGTGIDIKKLKVAIMTTAISSEKSNIQALGRLRELKDDDRPPYFFWLTCENIPKHLDYHRRKIELFKDRTKTVGTVYYDKRI